MNLTNTQVQNTYGNVLTIGTIAGSPVTGIFQNGGGSDITALTMRGALSLAHDNTYSHWQDSNLGLQTHVGYEIYFDGPSPVNIYNATTRTMFFHGTDTSDIKLGLGTSLDMIVCAANKNVGINTANPTAQLHVAGNFAAVDVSASGNVVAVDVSASGNLAATGTAQIDSTATPTITLATLAAGHKVLTNTASADRVLGTPDVWMKVTVNGVDYAFPGFTV
jgi:hypothetical protein